MQPSLVTSTTDVKPTRGDTLQFFMATLNNTFETELAQVDKGSEDGSESLNTPTPLSRTSRVYHVLNGRFIL